jgi:anti-sigma regulatory factor (Ser/Thr protein kinase)
MGAELGYRAAPFPGELRAAPLASELRLPARAAKLWVAREYAHAAAAAFGLDADRCQDFAFAVNEAATNAVRHGLPDRAGDIHLSVLADARRLTLSIHDCGTFSASHSVLGKHSERGRGFALMTRMMDAVQLCCSTGSTTVRLTAVRR